MITAIILAGGESKRMGRPKMLLPWGHGTVLDQVIEALKSGGIEDVEVVTGGSRAEVEAICKRRQVRAVFNEAYARDEMLGSLQTGLRGLGLETEAGLVTLGDQPQIEAATVRAVTSEYGRSQAQLIVPSYQRRRGHPWLIARPLWAEVLEMKAPESPREFLNRHASEIRYVEVESPSILQDLDTPEDYRKSRPRD